MLYCMSKMNWALRTPEDPAFRTFINALNPNYKVPSEQTCTKLMHKKYEELKNLFKQKIEKADYINLTADLWTDNHTMRSYLGEFFYILFLFSVLEKLLFKLNTKVLILIFTGVTAHFLEGEQIVSLELGAKYMPERKTAPNLRQAMNNICQSWNIEHDRVRAVVTDGGSNIKSAVIAEFGEEKHVECFAHKLNGVGQAVLGLSESKRTSMEDPIEVPEDEEAAADLLDDVNELER